MHHGMAGRDVLHQLEFDTTVIEDAKESQSFFHSNEDTFKPPTAEADQLLMFL